MKYSCSSVLLNSAGARDVPAMLDLAADAGYQGVMLACEQGGGFDPEAFSFRTSGAVVRHAIDRGIEIQCIGSACLQACEPDTDGEQLRRDVCIAHALACPLVCFSAPPHPGEKQFEHGYGRFLTIVREAIECARELDICLALQPSAGTMATTMDHVVNVVDDVDRPNLGVAYPPGFLSRSHGESATQAVAGSEGFLLMTQLDGIGGRDLLDGVFDAALDALRDASFSEYVCDCGPLQLSESRGATGALRARVECLRAWNTTRDNA